MRTLLIDDDPFALKLLARQLELLGCGPVMLCEHADDAVRLLRSDGEDIGLVFCDLLMPDMDGVEFVRHLARTGYRGGLVLVSGEDERVLQSVLRLAQAYDIQVLGAVPKPVSPSRLKEVLASNAARRTAPSGSTRQLYAPEELSRAIARGQLITHFQPKVELASGNLIGVEALVRWQHPQAGLVYPDQFVATAEEFGLIDALTRAVLAASLRQARLWRDVGLELQIAVNVSMDNLVALDFPDAVAQMATDAGITASNVVLEVTESRLMKDVRATLDILARLRLKRISLSIDDFGTGHSSLSQLRTLPFDELKLDRGFVNGAAQDLGLKAIVHATLTLARQLGMKSVAEGVEELADWNLLRRLGCDVAQGYFIARPMPGTRLVDWHAEWELRRGTLTGVEL